MQTGIMGILHRANHAVHLLAAGEWIGGLVPFVMGLDAYARDTLRRDAVTAMTRFSFEGISSSRRSWRPASSTSR